MKQEFITTLLIAFNCFTINAQNKLMNSTIENKPKDEHQKENVLGTGIFKAFKEKNSNRWIMLYPTNDEYKNILQQMLAAKTKELTQQNIDELLLRCRKEATGAYTTELQNFCKQADSLGINWKDAVYQKFDYTTAYPETVKLKYVTGDIWFSCKHRHFVIEGIEALQIGTGYRLQAVKGIRRVDDGE